MCCRSPTLRWALISRSIPAPGTAGHTTFPVLTSYVRHYYYYYYYYYYCSANGDVGKTSDSDYFGKRPSDHPHTHIVASVCKDSGGFEKRAQNNAVVASIGFSSATVEASKTEEEEDVDLKGKKEREKKEKKKQGHKKRKERRGGNSKKKGTTTTTTTTMAS